MRTTPLVIFGFAVVLLSGAEVASAFVSANTIDERELQEGRQVGAGERADWLLARRARLDQGHRHPTGDRSPRAEAVEEPLHGQGPAVAGYGARSPRDPL